jgi:hypothetical protein
MHAEAEHAHQRHCHQRQERRQRNTRALPRVGARQHEKRERQAGGQLDAHTRRQHARAGAQRGAPAPGPGAERQRARQRQHQQRVVVGSADAQHERHRVQPHEHRCPAWAVPETGGRTGDESHRGQAAEHRDRLERPQRPRDSERHQRIASEREQRPIRRALEGPSDEAEHAVGRRFRGHVRVRVQAVQRAQAGVGDVPEHVLGDQRRPERQDRVGRHDRARQHPRGQASRRDQYQQIAGAHDQHQRLEARARQAHPEPSQRPGQPIRPATAVGRDVLRGRRGGTGADQEDARQDSHQPERSQRAHGAARRRRAARAARAWLARGERGGRSGGGGRNGTPLLRLPDVRVSRRVDTL